MQSVITIELLSHARRRTQGDYGIMPNSDINREQSCGGLHKKGVSRAKRAIACSVLQNNVQGMDDTRDVAKDCQEDVDQKITVAATFEEDTQGREDDGNNNFEDIRCFERHFEGIDLRNLSFLISIAAKKL